MYKVTLYVWTPSMHGQWTRSVCMDIIMDHYNGLYSTNSFSTQVILCRISDVYILITDAAKRHSALKPGCSSNRPAV